MWLSSAEYNMRETEAWLAGEISSPRAVVTSIVSQVMSPQPRVGWHDVLGPGYNGVFSSPAKTHGDHRSEVSMDRFQPPFPHVSEANFGSPAVELSTSLHLENHSRNHYETVPSSRSKMKPRPLSRPLPEKEDELPVPPTRQRRSVIKEAVAQVAEEHEIERARIEEQATLHQLFEQSLAKGMQPTFATSRPHAGSEEFILGGGEANGTPDHRRGHRSYNQRKRSDISFVDPGGGAFSGGEEDLVISPPESDFKRKAEYATNDDLANDYRAMRSRLGRGAAPKTVALRQR
jgi:hypothetical protein